jgi:hypothetical protein
MTLFSHEHEDVEPQYLTTTKPTPPVPPDDLRARWFMDCASGEKFNTRRHADKAATWGWEQAIPEREELESAYADAISALRYIEQQHGRLYGVGWDRLYAAAERLRGGGSDG